MLKLDCSLLAKAVTIAVACATVSACNSTQSKIDDSALYVRSAQGDITQFAGARRIHDNQVELYEQALALAKVQHAKLTLGK